MMFSVLYAGFLGVVLARPVTTAVAVHTRIRLAPLVRVDAAPPAYAAGLAALLGVLTWSLADRLPPSVLVTLLVLTTFGVALAAIDTATYRLPDALTLPAYPLVLAGLVLAGDADSFRRALISAALALAAYGLVHVLRPAALGFGDVKLAGLLALPLGWLSWSTVASATVLAIVVGAGYAVIAYTQGRAHVPYGPALLLGVYLAVLTA